MANKLTEEQLHSRQQISQMLKIRFTKKKGLYERRILVMAHILYWFDVFYIQQYKIKFIKKPIKRVRKLKLSNLHRIIEDKQFQRFLLVHGGLDLPTSIMRMDNGAAIYSPVHSKDISDNLVGVFVKNGESFQFSIGMDDIYAQITMEGLFSFIKS